MGCSEDSTDILQTIVKQKREDLERVKKAIPIDSLISKARNASPRGFGKAISGGGISVIAELKKASPSAGLIRQDYNPVEIAKSYEAAGAAAVSVLTEERHFLGAIEHLTDVAQAVAIPVLRKDFIIDEYQIFESVAAGADALLLIARILTREEIAKYVTLCYTLRVCPLVEVHDASDIEKALAAQARVIGINNRDLATLRVNPGKTLELKKLIPADRLVVSESGIRSGRDLRELSGAGVHAALIGERLLRERDPGEALRSILRN